MSKHEKQNDNEEQKGVQVNANKVIDNLSLQIANLAKEMAILRAQNEYLQLTEEQNKKLKDLVKTQEKVIEAYKDKEKLNAKK